MMAVVNADTGKVITTLPIGDGVDANGFDPDTGFAFASCGEGVLTVVHEDSPEHFSVAQSVPTQLGSRTTALNPNTHQIFLMTANFGPSPDPTGHQPHPRPPLRPNSLLVVVAVHYVP